MRRLPSRFLRRRTFVVFAAVFASMLLYSFTRTKIYEGRAALEILHHRAYGTISQGLLNFHPAGSSDLNRFGAILSEERVMERVAAKLSSDDLRRLLRPFLAESQGPDPLLARQILRRHFRVEYLRLSQLVVLVYRHPDREVAARVANLFLDKLVEIQNEREAPQLKQVEDELARRIAERRAILENAPGGVPAESPSASSDMAHAPRKPDSGDELANLETALRRVREGYAGIAAVERARPPLASDYTEPNHLLDISIGLLAGLIAATAITLFHRPRPRP